MDLFAKKVKERAAEIGLTQAEVARRAGISERRFGHYMGGRSEPDLQLLVRIAIVLDVTPNELLGVERRDVLKKGDEAGRLRHRISAAASAMNADSLILAVNLVEAVLEHQGQRK